MPKIPNKTFKKLTSLIDDVISFNNVEEFESVYGEGKLFKLHPQFWTDEEKQICDYQVRISRELLAGIKDIFGKEDADAKN
jgi:hypothetical protein